MAAEHARACLTLLGLLSGACAAFGYDFSDYQTASGSAGDAGAMDEKAPEPVVDVEPDGEGGASVVCSSPSTGAAEDPGGAGPAGGATGNEDGTVFTTFGSGGAPLGGAPAAGGESASGEAGAPSCGPELFACFDAGAQCGSVVDSCGRALDCGVCFWWFEQCQHNQCVILPSP